MSLHCQTEHLQNLSSKCVSLHWQTEHMQYFCTYSSVFSFNFEVQKHYYTPILCANYMGVS
jgi:hypothetical protein